MLADKLSASRWRWTRVLTVTSKRETIFAAAQCRLNIAVSGKLLVAPEL